MQHNNYSVDEKKEKETSKPDLDIQTINCLYVFSVDKSLLVLSHFRTWSLNNTFVFLQIEKNVLFSDSFQCCCFTNSRECLWFSNAMKSLKVCQPPPKSCIIEKSEKSHWCFQNYQTSGYSISLWTPFKPPSLHGIAVITDVKQISEHCLRLSLVGKPDGTAINSGHYLSKCCHVGQD